jgi:hypothetical protein
MIFGKERLEKDVIAMAPQAIANLGAWRRVCALRVRVILCIWRDLDK